jgi:hypothetical protein
MYFAKIWDRISPKRGIQKVTNPHVGEILFGDFV